MPQRKSPLSLYKYCIENITNNIKYWTEHYEQIYFRKTVAEKARILYIIGPFDSLNTVIAEDLLQNLICTKKLSLPAFHLLINGGAITNLNLQNLHKVVVDDAIAALSKRSSSIRYLNMQRCNRISASAFHTLVTNLPNAISLDFSYTNIPNLVIHKIFHLCFHLQKLLLRGTQANDQDIHILCKLACNKGPLRLRHIDLTGTMVTEEGIKELLYYLPYLWEVEVGCLLPALDMASAFSPVISPEMEVRAPDDLNNKFSLQSLTCSDFMAVSDAGLDLIVEHCPFVRKVDLRFAIGLSSPGLLQLKRLENLRELRLGVDGSRDISYESSLRPLLEVRGQELQTLTLQDFHGVNIVEILYFCPNLQKLIVFMIEHGSLFGDYIPRPSLERVHLQELHIWNKLGDTSLTKGALESVLSHAQNLEILELIRVENFDDDLISSVLKHNQLLKMRNFSLNECNKVSGQVLTPLILNEKNSLKDVKLMNNWNVTLGYKKGLEKLISAGNFDISVDWS